MRRRGQVELLSLDPEPERTLNRLCKEQREAHERDLVGMQNQEGQDQGDECLKHSYSTRVSLSFPC